MPPFKEASFELPETLSAHYDKAQYQPAAVRKWLEQLSLNKRGESARALFIFLSTINQLDLPAEDRFAIMQMLCVLMDQIIDSLRNDLSRKSYPLSATEVKIAELCSEMVTKMVIGYGLVLRTGDQKGWLARRMRKGIWLASLERLLFYFRTILCGYQLINRSAPKGLWHSVHTLYRQTRKAGWHRDKLDKGRATTCAHSTIESAYIGLILASLMSRHQFRNDQFSEVQLLQEQFAPLVRLRPIDLKESSPQVFCISASHDTPPVAMHSRLHRECGGDPDDLIFDSSALGHYLAQLLTGEQSMPSIKGHPLTRDTAALLLETWCHPQARHEERVVGGGQVQITLGFSHTHQRVVSLAAASRSSQGSAEAEGDEVLTIEYDYRELGRQSWSLPPGQGISSGQLLTAEVVNHSLQGRCLHFTAPATGAVRYGDVLGLKYPNQAGWELARVCWLKSEESSQLILGVEVIIRSIIPVDLRVQVDAKRRSDPIPALLGNAKGGLLVLVMPYLPGAQRKRYEMTYLGHKIAIDFSRQLLTTPSFIAFRISAKGLPQGRGSSAKRELSHRKEEPAGSSGNDAVVSGLESDDEYAALWKKL